MEDACFYVSVDQFKLDFFITISLMKIIYFSGPPDSKSLRNIRLALLKYRPLANMF